MPTIRQILTATAFSVATAASAATPDDLTQDQQTALSLAKEYNGCVIDMYDDPNYAARLSQFNEDYMAYDESLYAFAKENGYMDKVRETDKKLQSTLQKLGDGTLTPEDEANFSSIFDEIAALENEIHEAALAAGIQEPADIPLPEQICDDALVASMTRQAMTDAQLEKNLDNALRILGEENFFNSIAP